MGAYDNLKVELTEMTISNGIHIAEKEVQEYKNKIVYVNADIACAGAIVFENCEIHYNAIPGTSCQITLEEGSTLHIKNCRVLCENPNENPLFKDDGATSVIIQDSVFEDCSYFIEKYNGEGGSFVLQGCEIIDPYIRFLDLNDVDEVSISNCLITFTKPLNEDDDNYDSIFYSSHWSKTDYATVREVVVNGNHLMNVKDEEGYFKKNNYILDMEYASYMNCTFENANGCIRDAGTISHCKFNQCVQVIDNEFYKKEGNIVHCIFEECESVIACDNTNISHCQFVKCMNSLIKSAYTGNVNVEYCEFYNMKYTDSRFLSACLSFYRAKGNEYGPSTVKKCIFNGAELNESFLLAGHTNDKIKGMSLYVEECRFQNCRTKRESGKIIKCYDTYINFFKRQIQIEVTSVQKCVGLDKVNKENGYIQDVVIRAADHNGAVIGAAADGFAVTRR
ncbi:hypothetical protein SK3146_03486 [Paenibacillus konkukensis]|uniref:Right handed beta helix domain-containing protein n=1 Tax=Paenibacillus konkukensis TaxID=2020716 RepID=A0ABY4RRY0_9BACL|nr:hypothetical protein [Paenibacillus konkukensis]UQZ84253.1 hypothetical protein SK3146_03486 [Paenibacillus konkukensis]